MSQSLWFICVNAIFVLFAENILLFGPCTSNVRGSLSFNTYFLAFGLSVCGLFRLDEDDKYTSSTLNNECGRINIQNVQITSEVYLKSSEFSNYTRIRKSFDTARDDGMERQQQRNNIRIMGDFSTGGNNKFYLQNDRTFTAIVAIISPTLSHSQFSVKCCCWPENLSYTLDCF